MTDRLSELPTKRSRLWHRLRVLMFIYLGICLLMMALENRLVYPRPRVHASNAWKINQADQANVTFTAKDGTPLHGWYFAHQDPQHAILFCHGNGEDLSRNADDMAFLRKELQAAVFIFDYRGYGKSEGSPHEAGIILDGLAAQRWLADKVGIATDEVVLMGRSLGGGVAIALAQQQGAKALILQNTFANMSEVAAEKFFWLPARWIMRNKFPSSERIQAYSGPLLQTHGTQDRVVPYAQGKKLFEAAPGHPKQWLENQGGGHNTSLPKGYYSTLRAFLQNLPSLSISLKDTAIEKVD